MAGEANDVHPCPLCGGGYPPGVRCRDVFDRALALEFADPAYGEVHHLTVPAYYVQHNLYSRMGWLWARAMLARAIVPGFDPAHFRREQRALVASGNRTASFTRGPKPEFYDQIVWRRTFADLRFADAAAYRADMRAIAATVVADTAAVCARWA